MQPDSAAGLNNGTNEKAITKHSGKCLVILENASLRRRFLQRFAWKVKTDSETD